LLSRGSILQQGKISDVVQQPNCAAAAQMLGGWNILHVNLKENMDWGDRDWKRLLDVVANDPSTDGLIDIGVPVSGITLKAESIADPKDGFWSLAGTVHRVAPWYGQLLATVDCTVTKLMVELADTSVAISSGQPVTLSFPISAVRKWPAQ